MTYLTNYEGVERLDEFTPASLAAYREMLLEKTHHQSEFIRKHVVEPLGRPKINVVEFGSGNGRLLVDLALKGLLKRGFGLDISRSRADFAQQWSNELDTSLQFPVQLSFMQADMLKYTIFSRYDLAVCITGCFNYLRPSSVRAPEQALASMRHSAAYSLFELYKVPLLIKHFLSIGENWIRTWDSLPADDPWKYYMNEWGYDFQRKIMTHNKVFVGRDGTLDEGRSEQLYYYSLDEFVSLLHSQGYTSIEWAVQDDTKMVVLAR